MTAPASPPGIPGFEVERRLGQGASCEVWLAREREGLRRPVALKVFRGAAEGYRRELAVVREVEEIRREARCGALVQSLAVGEAEGLAFIAFEWLEGGTLEERVARGGPLPFADAVACAREVALALGLLHARGLFHRDVKPSNLLLGRDGRVRVADFGLSRPLEGTLSSAGSPAFAAPEAIAGRPQDGRRLDVYSLGATLAYLLTGETMLPGRPDVFLLERHGVPRPLQRVIVRAMAALPADRLASVEGLLAALDEAAGVAPPAPVEPDPEPAPAHSRARRVGEATPAEVAEQRRRAWDVVEKTGYAAAAATTLPLPGSEWVAVLPLHVTMVIGVGEAYGCSLEREGAADLLKRIGGAVGLSYVGSRAVTSVAKLLLPGLGGLAGAALTYATTLALGQVTLAFFERGGAMGEAELREVYQRGLLSARRSYAERPAGERERRFVLRLAQVERLLESGLITADEHQATLGRLLREAGEL